MAGQILLSFLPANELVRFYLSEYFCYYMQTGLSLLQKELNIPAYPNPNPKNSREGAPIPIYSFIAQMVAAFKDYLNAQFQYSWAEYLICNRKHQTIQLVKSWIFHSKHSLQAQLLSSLLLANDIKKCKLFLRLRKYVLQLTNVNMLDQIILKHQDVITIVHRMFPLNIKREIMNGLKQIFISYKVTDAKIYACVFIEYILSVYDSIDQNQQSFMVGETKMSSNIVLSNFSSISKFNSNLHKENGLYRKVETNENSYTVIQTKFLPQKLEKQKTKFEEQPFGSQYYSNSYNFLEESLHLPKNLQKENSKQNLNFSSQQHENSRKKIIDPEQKSQIKIQQEGSYSQEFLNGTNNFSRKSMHKEIQEVIHRNQIFKTRLLSGKTSIKLQLSHEEQDSINETINIIHSSIVRNRREKL